MTQQCWKQQCWFCAHWCFFKPLPDDTYSCCTAFGETIDDIDLQKGYSPMVEKYLSGEEKCPRFEEGESICESKSNEPFNIDPIRRDGETLLFQRLIPKK